MKVTNLKTLRFFHKGRRAAVDVAPRKQDPNIVSNIKEPARPVFLSTPRASRLLLSTEPLMYSLFFTKTASSYFERKE